MKKALLLITFLSSSLLVVAQTSIISCENVLNEAEQALINKKYALAIIKYKEAKLCMPKQAKDIDEKIYNTANTIDYHLSQANREAVLDKASLLYTNELNNLLSENKLQTTKDVQFIGNALLSLQLKKESPNIANAIAYYNYQKYPEEIAVAEVFHELISHSPAFENQSIRNSFMAEKLLAVQKDSALLLTKDLNKATLYNQYGAVLQEFRGHTSALTDISFSASNGTILTGSRDKTAKLWGSRGNLIQTFKGHNEGMSALTFSPDGKTVLTASEDKTAKLWNLEGKMLQTFHAHEATITCMDYMTNATIITGSKDKTAIVWDEQANKLYTLEGHQDEITCVQFSPNAKYLLTSSLDSTTILWNSAGQQLHVLNGHQGSVNAATFSTDGQFIITGGVDKTLKVWDLHGNNIQTLVGHNAAIKSISCSPDGQFIWSVDAHKAVKSWWTIPAFFDLKPNQFSLAEMVLEGLSPDWEDVNKLTNQTQLNQLYEHFCQRQSWGMITNIYHKLDKKQQNKAPKVLCYYDAKSRIEPTSSDELLVYNGLSYWAIFAPYFAQKGDTTKALFYYDKMIQNGGKISPTSLSSWYDLAPSDSNFITLEMYQDWSYVSHFSMYFYQQKQWSHAKVFFDKMLALNKPFSAAQMLARYETEKALGNDRFEWLKKEADWTKQTVFAAYFRQKQEWEKALPFYDKINDHNPTVPHVLERYEIQQHLNIDQFDDLTDVAYMDEWEDFGRYFEQKQEWEKARILYQKNMELDNTPERRYFVCRVSEQLGINAFQDLFLQKNEITLKQNYQFFNQKVKENVMGYRKEFYQKAAKIGEYLLVINDSRSNRQELATFYHHLAWDRLYAKDFIESFTYLKQEKQIKSKQELYKRLMPPLLLLLGEFDQAKKLYKKWRHKSIPSTHPKQPLKDIYLADLKEFEKRGLIKPELRPYLHDIKSLLAKRNHEVLLSYSNH